MCTLTLTFDLKSYFSIYAQSVPILTQPQHSHPWGGQSGGLAILEPQNSWAEEFFHGLLATCWWKNTSQYVMHSFPLPTLPMGSPFNMVGSLCLDSLNSPPVTHVVERQLTDRLATYLPCLLSLLQRKLRSLSTLVNDHDGSLRPRQHDRQLTRKSIHTNDCLFIIRRFVQRLLLSFTVSFIHCIYFSCSSLHELLL